MARASWPQLEAEPNCEFRLAKKQGDSGGSARCDTHGTVVDFV
jgi:hypothetical protein